MALLRAAARVACAAALAGGLAACELPGRGEGWALGKLWVKNCRDGDPLDGDYDLDAGFFVGDPFFDSNDELAQRRNTLVVRIQQTSSPVEEADALMLMFQDLTVAAQRFAERQPLAIADESLCPGCTDFNTAVRMQLTLPVRCPSTTSPLSAMARALTTQKRPLGQGTCKLPAKGTTAACPTLSADDRAELDDLCADDSFDDRQRRSAIERILGAGGVRACLYLCELGDLERGADSARLQRETFALDYGHTIAALFYARLLDARSLRTTTCASAEGKLSGRFRFELVRSRVAQPFP